MVRAIYQNVDFGVRPEGWLEQGLAQIAMAMREGAQIGIRPSQDWQIDSMLFFDAGLTECARVVNAWPLIWQALAAGTITLPTDA